MSKQALIIVAVIAVLALGALGFILLSPTPDPGEQNRDGGDFFGEPGGGLPPLGGEGSGAEPPEELRRGLVQLHDKPVAGSMVFDRDGKAFVRIMEQESGHVWEIEIGSGARRRISNTTIPGIARAQFSEDGERVLFEFTDAGIPKAAVGVLAGTTTSSNAFVSVSFLPEGSFAPTLSPSGSSVFYLVRENEGVSGIVSGSSGADRRNIFSSPLRQWEAAWQGESAILLSLKPGDGGGLLLSLNPRTGGRTVLAAGFSFSATLPSRTPGVALAGPLVDGALPRISLWRAQGGFDSFSIPNAIPEKCSFMATSTPIVLCGISAEGAGAAGALASWYQGLFQSTDELWQFDLADGRSARLMSVRDLGERSFDMTDIHATEAGLLFTDKQSGLPWGMVRSTSGS